MSLPKAASSSAFVDVTIFLAGTLDIPEYLINKDAPKEPLICPVYAFLIEHKTLGKKVFFDLGLSKDLDIYSPRSKDLFEMFKPAAPSKTLAEAIALKGIKPEEISQVILSHVHWDHCHPFASYLPNATALFGPTSIDACHFGWPTNPDSEYFSELADRNHPWSKNVHELPPITDPRWKPFGPFERAWDLWGDGSLWLIDAPGHKEGNLAAAARLKDGEWIVMGGDCAHSRKLLLGLCEIGTWKNPEGKEVSMHGNKEMAKETIQKLRKLGEMEGVHLALAHVNIDETGDAKLKSLLLNY